MGGDSNWQTNAELEYKGHKFQTGWYGIWKWNHRFYNNKNRIGTMVTFFSIIVGGWIGSKVLGYMYNRKENARLRAEKNARFESFKQAALEWDRKGRPSL
ncbi:hypothetical protein DPMN_067674 [Dreissena polymorpha]|uniref:Uncharacterized protein n=1 Tax=Dreissena polymorpha TaxID=45954 RepID=A0A9D4BSZ6_DREPO|nr:hypothetical protein DPMN_067674 [Dreissena polymorpha]